MAGPDLSAVARALGHEFRDPALLREALTHSSAVSEGRGADRSYERLEFVGDRVLALAIAEMLAASFPNDQEGQLSRRHTALVRAETCAEVAAEIGLGPHLVLGGGEKPKSGGPRASIMADACEALLGAIFLDAGYPTAAAFVARHWRSRLIATDQVTLRDAKTRLQEALAAKAIRPPTYRLLAQAGPAHDPEFEVRVEVDGMGVAEGRGRNKRQAEQRAAEAFLAAHAASLGQGEGAPHG